MKKRSTWRERITDQAAGLFSHAPDPLAGTFNYPNDPGMFGPGSPTWTIMSDVSTFIGGIRSLLVQAAHPEVAAGVGDHSSYHADPLGRLSRTASYVTVTSYGALPEIDQAIAAVRQAHRPVSGTSHRGRKYSAAAPDMAAWVHNALIDSFLVAHQVYWPTPLSPDQADAYVAEQTRLGNRMNAHPLPDTATDLSRWLVDHPSLSDSPAGRDALRFVARPPLPLFTALAYRILFQAAVATLPPEICQAIGVTPRRGAKSVGRLLIKVLRRAMGYSPAWGAALDRCGHPRVRGKRIRSTEGVTR